ncbi:MAG: hypothetical protein KDC85_11770 [Saprospiraceae bacterium]|nr:hypothetical protein [Saprospiraceae bacterium]MCB9326179.1 hypothetical protein [Lewinellaceae bacterium]
MRKVFLCLIGMGLVTIASAQEQSPTVMAAAGGSTAKGAAMTLDWTLGELSVSSLETPNGLLTEGFHQPMLRVETILESPVKQGGKDLEMTLAPNPVSSSLSIRIHSEWEGEGELALWDARGQRLQRATVDLSLAQLEWDLGGYASGIYSVTLRDAKGLLLRSYKISKID